MCHVFRVHEEVPGFDPEVSPEQAPEQTVKLIAFVEQAVATRYRTRDLASLAVDLSADRWVVREGAVRQLRLISGREFGYQAERPAAAASFRSKGVL